MEEFKDGIPILFPSDEMDKSTAKKNTVPINNVDVNIKIIGVGGAGTNAVSRMANTNITGVQLYAVNTDIGSLKKANADTKVSIGNGLGVGGNPDKGKKYAEEAVEQFKEMLQGADMVFITTGMGGGTGTGAAPVIAKVAKELKILTVGVVTRPFTAEGSERVSNANKGIAELREYTDALIIIPNDRIFSLIDEKTHYEQGFVFIDDVLRRAIESITDTIIKTGTVNIDFADVKNVLENAGNAIIGLGNGATFEEAFNEAIRNQFVEGEDITEAKKVLVNLSYSNNNEIILADVQKIYNYAAKEFKHYTSLKVGNIENNELDTTIKVSIIASFPKEEDEKKVNEELFPNIENKKEENFIQDKTQESFFNVPACDLKRKMKL